VSNQFSDPRPFEPLTRIQVLSIIGVTAIVLLLVTRLLLLFDPIPMVPVYWTIKMVLMGLGLGILITLTSSAVYQLWPAYRRSADFYLEFILQPLVWPDLIWLGLLPGLSEELLFRGVVLPAIGFNVVGVILSSLCFGILHLSGRQQWPYMVWASVVGLLLGFSALLTGNLLVPIVAHILTNLISGLVWKSNH
jgi:membrane protease YdiL (CAAX protease family)